MHNRTTHSTLLGLIVAAIALAAVVASPATVAQEKSKPSIFGTWTGESICVGPFPACKNETVVYRFLPVDGKPDGAALYGDKIIDGVREPMGKLDVVFDAVKGTATAEFTVRTTHGVFEFTFDDSRMTGSLFILPERTKGRAIKVHRVSESDVPPAPPLDQY